MMIIFRAYVDMIRREGLNQSRKGRLMLLLVMPFNWKVYK